MKGLWIQNGTISFRDDLEEPRPRQGNAIVRVRLSGICGTDLELQRGYASFVGIPGHEFVGTVADCPEDSGLEGKRVVADINVDCGRCGLCRRGLKNHCRERSVIGIRGWNGAMAEFVEVPVENLHEVPPHLSDDCAVFLEPLAAALRLFEQVELKPGMNVLVIGAGRLGQLIVRCLRWKGIPPVVITRGDSNLDLLAGIAERVCRLDQLPRGEMDVVIDATGDVRGVEMALLAVRPEGTVVLKSTSAESTASLDLSRLVVDEIRLVGSRCGNLDQAMSVLSGGTFFDLRPLLDGVFPLREGVKAFHRAGESGAMKVLVDVATR